MTIRPIRSRGRAAEHRRRAAAAAASAQDPRAHRIVDIVVDVGDDVGDARDLPFDRAGAVLGSAPTGMPLFPFEWRAMPSRTSQVRFSPCPSCSSTSTIRRLCS